jgi:hypothetical protein
MVIEMKIKIIPVVIILMLISSISFGQNISNISLINEIADKDEATFEDGIRFVMLLTGKNPASFQENIVKLNNEGITQGIQLDKDSPLRRGVLSLMLARHLDLKDSLLYKIFKTQRYAYRACVANDLMHYEGSEWDKLSGGELVEIMAKASDFSGGNE